MLVTTKNKAIVKIYGQEYAIVSDKDREQIQRLSNYVDDMMREISGKNKKLSTAMVAVLTALNMSEELFGEKEKNNNLEETNQIPDKAINEKEDEIADLKGLLKERAIDIDRLENAVEEGKKVSGALKRKEEHLKETIASREKSIEEKDKENCNLEKKIDELKDKLVECEVKLIQSRKELTEFMDAFEK